MMVRAAMTTANQLVIWRAFFTLFSLDIGAVLSSCAVVSDIVGVVCSIVGWVPRKLFNPISTGGVTVNLAVF